MSDDHPFDRAHWIVGVSFPVEHLADKDAILAEVGRLAERRGGVVEMTSYPAAEFLGRPGYDTFGAAVAFEAGDVNADGFILLAQERLAARGVRIEFDPEEVFAPDGEGEASGPRL